MVALILAAGKGSRLGDYTADLPKSLLPLNTQNKTLLDYNLQVLGNIKLERIYVVTGFNSTRMEDHLKNYKSTQVVYNPFWQHCNVLGSLYMALDSLHDDFLFLHADTLADPAIWKELTDREGDFVLPYQAKKCGKEEMKVLIEDGELVEISKELNPAQADGEFLGIAKFSKKTIPFFKETSTRLFKRGELNHYMESVIQEAIKFKGDFRIHPFDIGNSSFVEVDFEEDYFKAKELFGGKDL